MRLFQVLLGLLIFSAFEASELPKFYFLEAPNEIRTAIGTPELYEKLRRMNTNSDLFEISKSILEPEIIMEYVRAQVDIASSLYRREYLIDFKSSEMKTFASHLVKTFQEHSEIFDENRLLDVFTIFIASGTIQNSVSIREIFTHHLMKLKPIPRFKFLEQMIKYASIETVFIVPNMLTEDFVSSSRIETFLNNYIATIFNRIDPAIYSEILGFYSMLLICIAKADLVLSNRSYELLLTATKEAIDGPHIIWHEAVLAALNSIFEKFSKKKPLVQLTTDIVFRILILREDEEDYHDANMVSLMTQCTRADTTYFRSVLERAPISNSKILELYSKQLKTSTMALTCFENLRVLTSSSEEMQYRLALSSAKNLRNIYKTSPETFDPIPSAFDVLKLFNIVQLSMLQNIDHQFNTFSYKIVVYLSLIEYDTTSGNQKIIAAGNIAYGLGHLLLNSMGNSKEYPTELVEEVTPILDAVIENLCLLSKVSTKPMTAIDLSAYFRFIRLHSSVDVVDSATDQLCLALITSMPIKQKGYMYVKGLNFTNEAEIAVAGYLHFVQKYLNNPRRDDLNDFKGYFDHLVSNHFLNKSQALAIRRIFRNFI